MQEKHEVVQLSKQDLRELTKYMRLRDERELTPEEAEHVLEIVDRAA